MRLERFFFGLLVIASCAEPSDQEETTTADIRARPLVEVVAISGIDDVCPSARSDVLCASLREAASGDVIALARARDAVRGALHADGPAALADDAVRFFMRERAQALLVREALEARGTTDGRFVEHVDEITAELFPAYPANSFPLSHVDLPAELGTCDSDHPRAAIVLFVGILRSKERTEFAEQLDAIARKRSGSCRVRTSRLR